MMVLLQAMQGLGAPGRSIWGTTMGAPNDTTCWVPGYGEPERPHVDVHQGGQVHPAEPEPSSACGA